MERGRRRRRRRGGTAGNGSGRLDSRAAGQAVVSQHTAACRGWARGRREWQLDFMFQLYVDGRMYEYVKKKERRRRIKAKGAQEERSRTVGRSENSGGALVMWWA